MARCCENARETTRDDGNRVPSPSDAIDKRMRRLEYIVANHQKAFGNTTVAGVDRDYDEARQNAIDVEKSAMDDELAGEIEPPYTLDATNTKSDASHQDYTFPSSHPAMILLGSASLTPQRMPIGGILTESSLTLAKRSSTLLARFKKRPNIEVDPLPSIKKRNTKETMAPTPASSLANQSAKEANGTVGEKGEVVEEEDDEDMISEDEGCEEDDEYMINEGESRDEDNENAINEDEGCDEDNEYVINEDEGRDEDNENRIDEDEVCDEDDEDRIHEDEDCDGKDEVGNCEYMEEDDAMVIDADEGWNEEFDEFDDVFAGGDEIDGEIDDQDEVDREIAEVLGSGGDGAVENPVASAGAASPPVKGIPLPETHPCCAEGISPVTRNVPSSSDRLTTPSSSCPPYAPYTIPQAHLTSMTTQYNQHDDRFSHMVQAHKAKTEKEAEENERELGKHKRHLRASEEKVNSLQQELKVRSHDADVPPLEMVRAQLADLAAEDERASIEFGALREEKDQLEKEKAALQQTHERMSREKDDTVAWNVSLQKRKRELEKALESKGSKAVLTLLKTRGDELEKVDVKLSKIKGEKHQAVLELDKVKEIMKRYEKSGTANASGDGGAAGVEDDIDQ